MKFSFTFLQFKNMLNHFTPNASTSPTPTVLTRDTEISHSEIFIFKYSDIFYSHMKSGSSTCQPQKSSSPVNKTF